MYMYMLKNCPCKLSRAPSLFAYTKKRLLICTYVLGSSKDYDKTGLYAGWYECLLHVMERFAFVIG